MIPTAHKNAHHAPAADAALSLSVHAKPKYFLMSGGMYLHQGGGHLQNGRQYAWKGTMEQARNIRRTFSAAVGCKAVAVSPLPQHVEEGA